VSHRLVTVAVLSGLIATGTGPSYCADMLRSSAHAASDTPAAPGAVTSSHEHHHHSGAASQTLNFTSDGVGCSDCGQLTEKAVPPDGRAKLMFMTEAVAVASDQRLRTPFLSAAFNYSTNSPAPPLLISLRI
jgi:hypothetical protein